MAEPEPASLCSVISSGDSEAVTALLAASDAEALNTPDNVGNPPFCAAAGVSQAVCVRSADSPR